VAGKTLAGQPGGAAKIVLATGNRGKLREIQALLGDQWALIPQSEFGISPVDETGTTFAENALLKARHAAGVTKLPAIADDSGLEVDALGGAPGVWSARYAGVEGDDAGNNQKLLTELSDVAPADRAARFRCVVVFVRDADDPNPVFADGDWNGTIAMAPSGVNGFGYDPVFIDAESGLTGGQLEAEQKNLLSHRGIAVRQLRGALARLMEDGQR
jgi:XTP/dITP diphosphohydrolase